MTTDELGPYAGYDISAIFWHSYDGSSPDGVVKVYDEGTATQPGAEITTEPYTGASAPGFYRADLTTPVPIDGSAERWCTIEVTRPAGTYPASVDSGPHFPGKSQWICIDGTWYELAYFNGSWTWNWVMGVIVEAVGIEELTLGEEVIAFGFAPMVNPVKGNVTISYTTTLPGHVSVRVYDRTGALVKTLVNDVQPVGTKIINWNTTGIASGVYFVRLEAEGNADTHKLIVVK